MPKTIAVIGGGPAGLFAAISCAEANPGLKVVVFERSRHILSKVRISGGGRCNLTHACSDPHELIRSYPRGSRELLGPFHFWKPGDTVDWFESKGVALKTEADGRVFPVTDRSSTIVDCLMTTAAALGIEVRVLSGISSVSNPTSRSFVLSREAGGEFEADRVVLASGGGERSGGLRIAEALGHTITELAPSLFSFHIEDPRIEGLPGLSVQNVRIACNQVESGQTGPLLITHQGLSGPVILKLSAWGARAFARSGYSFEIRINWLGEQTSERVRAHLNRQRSRSGRKSVLSHRPFDLPRRIWERLTEAADIPGDAQWAQVSRSRMARLTDELVDSRFQVSGKSMNKEEFVTCGGVRLGEVDFRRMESRLVRGLFFAGEVLDIDGLTGGFNFQAAWTTGRIAGTGLSPTR